MTVATWTWICIFLILCRIVMMVLEDVMPNSNSKARELQNLKPNYPADKQKDKPAYKSPIAEIVDEFKEMSFLQHTVGEGFSIFYGAFRGYSCGICDTRPVLIVHASGYQFRGQNVHGQDSWFMFAS